jgi:chemotaxis protein histidine kinase CheA
MPKLRKEDTDDIDVDELESAEYNEEQYSSYGGEVPPADTILRAYIKNMWYTRTNPKPGKKFGNPMLKVLLIADENEEELEEYNGLPLWENMSLTPGAKFKWAPFLSHFGLTIRDVKSKIVVAEDDDSQGAPIQKIASLVPGSDESWCRVITSRESYDGKMQAHVRSWLPYDEDEQPEEVEEEEEAEEEEEEEVDEEQEPERGRRTAAKPAAAKPAATARKVPAATTTRSAPRKAATTASAPAKSRAATSPKRGRRNPAADDEPPF